MTNRIIDTDLFQEVFKIVELENEDKYLLKKLKENAVVTELSSTTISIDFNGKIYILILNDLDTYTLHAPEEVYCNNENQHSKLSSDRIYFYLNRILDLVMYGR